MFEGGGLPPSGSAGLKPRETGYAVDICRTIPNCPWWSASFSGSPLLRCEFQRSKQGSPSGISAGNLWAPDSRPDFLHRISKRRAKTVHTLSERIQRAHTAAQRAGWPRNLADDLLSLHESGPQFVPETNLRFHLSAALTASVHLGGAFSFAVYAMAALPEMYERIRSEADALFRDGDPDGDDFTPSAMDVTHRFLRSACACTPSYRCPCET